MRSQRKPVALEFSSCLPREGKHGGLQQTSGAPVRSRIGSWTVHRADLEEKVAWIKALVGLGNLIIIILFASFLAELVSSQTTKPLLCL